jgi:tetratricopeptide (TPR) repeat protein
MSEEAKKEATEAKAIDAKNEATKAKAEAKGYQIKSRDIEAGIMVNRIVHERDGQGYKLLKEQKYSEAARFFGDIICEYQNEKDINPDITEMANGFVKIANDYFIKEEVVNAINFYMDAIQIYRLALITRNNKSREKVIHDGDDAENKGNSFFYSKKYDEACKFYKLATEHYKNASALYQTYIGGETSKDSGSSPGLEKQGGYKKRKSNRKHPSKHNRIRAHKHKHKWSLKYKRSIDCKHPKGFSQRQHCKYGRKTMRKLTRKK